MVNTLKRKSPDGEELDGSPPPKRKTEQNEDPSDVEPATESKTNDEAKSLSLSNTDDSAGMVLERQQRFQALKARQAESRADNRKETAAEAQRQATDPSLLTSLNRKRAIANQKLMKADAVAEGEDFERKRAWDWTIDESEKWDRRMEKKANHKNDVAFQDYRQDARKTYKRQMRELKPDLDAYEKEKIEAMQRAAQSGGLEVVETDDGEIIAVDKNGSFYSTANSTEFMQHKPERAAVDRLVNDLRKAEEARMAKYKARNGKDDDGDVTYINEKNKQFNQKLARFYDKYTSDIRDSFERGTAI